MIHNRGVITASTFCTMFFVGVGTAVIGAASKNIGLTAPQIGLMITLQNAGFLFSVLICGALADTVRKTLLLSIASIVLGISFSLFYLWPGFGVNLAIMIVIGIGMGAYEGVADTLLLEIHTKRENLYISVNHFFVTFGELMITVYLIFLQMRWRRSILQAGIAVAVLAVLFALSRTKTKEPRMRKLSDRFKHMREQRGTGALFFLTISAVGMELGIIGVLTAFLVDYRGFDLISSKLGLVAFLGGVAAGRAVIGFIAKKERLLSFLTGLFVLTFILTGVLFFVPLGTALLFLILFLLGVTLSAIFPIIISITGLRYKQIAGTVLGIVKLGIPVGGIVIPFSLSLIANWQSFQTALLLFPLFGLAGSAVILFQRKQLR
jgi:MFS family permease